MDENITLDVTLTRESAQALTQFLKRRVETLQCVKNYEGSEAFAESPQERDAIGVVLTALEAAVPPHSNAETGGMKSVLERLSQKISEVPFLESAEKDAHRALAQATESLARAHAVFAASLASAGEIESSAAAAAIGVEETKLQRAQATYDDAAERVMERKAEDSEVNRRAAYAQSKRAHDEALSALRRYEPLALEMLKLFSVLTMHADLAQADVEVADKARINPHARKAVGHLKAALEEHKLSHPDAVTKHIEDALHHLELAAD